MSFETEAAAGILPTHYPARDGATVCIATMEDQHLYLSWKWQFEHFHRSPLYMALQREKERRAQIRRETREAEHNVMKETGRIPSAKEALLALRKVVAKDRTLFRKLQKTTKEGSASRERAFGEANVCDRVVKLIDDELKKQNGENP